MGLSFRNLADRQPAVVATALSVAPAVATGSHHSAAVVLEVEVNCVSGISVINPRGSPSGPDLSQPCFANLIQMSKEKKAV